MRLAELAKEIGMTEDGESISWPYNVTTAEKRLTKALLRIEQLEKALKFLIECENWTKLVAEVEGKPYTNSGLQWAQKILEDKNA